MEALAVFFDAEGFAAGAAFEGFDSIDAHHFDGDGVAVAFVGFIDLVVFLVVAVGAAAESVALLSCGVALAVEFHALRVAAVAVFLVVGFLGLLERSHYLFLNLNWIHPKSSTFETQKGLCGGAVGISELGGGGRAASDKKMGVDKNEGIDGELVPLLMMITMSFDQ